jgi:hypothetical protein
MIYIIDAIKSLNSDAKVTVEETGNVDTAEILWLDGTPEISKADIKVEMDKLQAEYDSQDYARNRKAEYPTIEELVVALYDTDDKSAIEAKRAEVKAKYPKS